VAVHDTSGNSPDDIVGTTKNKLLMKPIESVRAFGIRLHSQTQTLLDCKANHSIGQSERASRQMVSKKWVILGVAIAVSIIMIFSTVQLLFNHAESGIQVVSIETAPNTRTVEEPVVEWGVGYVRMEGFARVTVTLHNYANSDANVTIKIYVECGLTVISGNNQTYENRQVTDYETRTILVGAHSEAKTTSELKAIPSGFGSIVGKCEILAVTKA